jgi:hypothetical protein
VPGLNRIGFSDRIAASAPSPARFRRNLYAHESRPSTVDLIDDPITACRIATLHRAEEAIGTRKTFHNVGHSTFRMAPGSGYSDSDHGNLQFVNSIELSLAKSIKNRESVSGSSSTSRRLLIPAFGIHLSSEGLPEWSTRPVQTV